MKQVMKCGDCEAVLEPKLRDNTLFIDHRCNEAEGRNAVLEEAATECDALGRMAPNNERGFAYDVAAKVIRELKRNDEATETSKTRYKATLLFDHETRIVTGNFDDLCSRSNSDDK